MIFFYIKKSLLSLSNILTLSRFFTKFMIELLRFINIKNHAINLIEKNQTLFGLIYILEPLELETLMIYIKNWPINLPGLLNHQMFWLRFYCKKDISLKSILIILETSKFLIFWAIPGIIFHLIRFDKCILLEKYL